MSTPEPAPAPTSHGVYPRGPAAHGRKPHRSLSKVLLSILYVVAIGYWTYLLLKPGPVPDRYFDDFSWFDKELLKLILAKCLHLGVYAVLAIVGGALVPPGRLRIAVFAALVLHGAASEFGQWVGGTYFGTNRHGTVRDVLIDAAGVAAGAYILRRWDRASSQ